MSKRATMLALIVLCIGALTGAVMATPSTLVWIPSTDIQAPDSMHFGVDYYAPTDDDLDATTVTGLTIGSGKFEFGIDHLSIDGGYEDPIRLNAKALLMDENGSAPRVVLGVYDLGGDAASNQVYLLGSKTFDFGRLTLGYSIGKKSALEVDENMILAGIDKQLSEKWWGAIDYQSGDSAFGALSAGVAYAFNGSTSLLVGYDWYNCADIEDTMTVQLDINF